MSYSSEYMKVCSGSTVVITLNVETRRSLVQVQSGCQYYEARSTAQSLHKTSFYWVSTLYIGTIEQLNIKDVTGTCKLIDGCSIERCVRPRLQWHHMPQIKIKCNEPQAGCYYKCTDIIIEYQTTFSDCS